MYKEELLQKLRRNTREQYDMPDSHIAGITYPDAVAQFVEASKAVGAHVLIAQAGESLDSIVRLSGGKGYSLQHSRVVYSHHQPRHGGRGATA